MDKIKEAVLREQSMHLQTLRSDPGWDLVLQRLRRLEQDYQSQLVLAVDKGDQAKAASSSGQLKAIKLAMELPDIMSAEINNALRRTKE